jgi:hypothetical protein
VTKKAAQDDLKESKRMLTSLIKELIETENQAVYLSPSGLAGSRPQMSRVKYTPPHRKALFCVKQDGGRAFPIPAGMI